MKQLSYFVALAALLMFASCQKEDAPTESSVKVKEDLVFTATIANDATKTSLSGTSISWTMSDEITIKDASSTSVKYEVSAIDKTTGVATFIKKSGETGTLVSGPYTATYGEAPSTSQTYTATDGVQNVTNLPMSASSSTTSLTFTVSCGLLKVTLNQTGISISSIAVSNGTDTYTLTCNDAVSIESGATFYIAVPAGTYTSFKFTESNGYVSWRSPLSIAVTENHIKPVSSTFGPEYKVNGTLYGYGSKINNYWWAPVNCGYDASHTYGRLYQWGRKVGGGYNSTEGKQTAAAASDSYDTDGYNKNPNDGKFYTQSISPCDWYTNDSDKQLSAWPMTSSDEGYVDGKIASPCPIGWRVPTYDQLNALTGNKSIGKKGWDSTNGGYWFNGSTSPQKNEGLFFPAAGYRNYSYGDASCRGDLGYYWSSSVYGGYAWLLYFDSDGALMYDSCRANGFSVRCVQEYDEE